MYRFQTLPLLFAQIWPQYRTARVLYLYMIGDKRWKSERMYIEKQLSSIGKLLKIKTDSPKRVVTIVHVTTISGHLLANLFNIFHKTEALLIQND